MSMRRVAGAAGCIVFAAMAVLAYRFEWDQALIDWYRGGQGSATPADQSTEPGTTGARPVRSQKSIKRQLAEFEQNFWMPVDPVIASGIEEAMVLISSGMPREQRPVISTEESRTWSSGKVTFTVGDGERPMRLDWTEIHRPGSAAENIRSAAAVVNEFTGALGVATAEPAGDRGPVGDGDPVPVDRIEYRPALDEPAAWLRTADALADLALRFRAFDDSEVEYWFTRRAFAYWAAGLALGGADDPVLRAKVLIALDRPALALDVLEGVGPSRDSEVIAAYARRDQAGLLPAAPGTLAFDLGFDLLERAGESKRGRERLDEAGDALSAWPLARWRRLQEGGFSTLFQEMPAEIRELTGSFRARFREKGLLVGEQSTRPAPSDSDIAAALAEATWLSHRLQETGGGDPRMAFWRGLFEQYVFAAARKYHLGTQWYGAGSESEKFARAIHDSYPQSGIAVVGVLRYLQQYGSKQRLDEYLSGVNTAIVGPWAAREIARVQGSQVASDYWRDAFLAYRAYVERESHGARGLRRLAYFAHHSFQPLIARSAAQRSWRIDPYDWRVYRDLANYENDPAWYGRMLQKPYEAMLAEAHARSADGQVEKALALLDAAIGQQPGDNQALRAKARILSDAGRHEQAREALEKQLAMAEEGLPRSYSASLLGYQLIRMGEHEQALKVFRESSRSHQLIGLQGLATALRLTGNLAGAIEVARQAADRYPGSRAAGQLAVLMALAGNGETLQFGASWELARGMISACDYGDAAVDCLVTGLRILAPKNRTEAARMIARELESSDRDGDVVDFSESVLGLGVDRQYFVGRLHCMKQMDETERRRLFQGMERDEQYYFFNIIVSRGCFESLGELVAELSPDELGMPSTVRAVFAAMAERMTGKTFIDGPPPEFGQDLNRAVHGFLRGEKTERALKAHVGDTRTAKRVEYYAGIHDWSGERREEAMRHFLFASTRPMQGDPEAYWAFGHLSQLGDRPVGWCCNDAIY